MADNAFLDATEYANTMLLLLKNQLVMGRLVSGRFKDEVTDENGLSINIKRPPQFVAQDGATLASQPLVVGRANVAVDQYKNVHCDVGDLEYAQSYNDLMKDATMKSAASELAHAIDSYLHTKLIEFYSEVGTPGDALQTALQYNKGHTRLMEQSVPNEDINAVLSFEDGELIRGALTATDISGINRTALERVRIPMISETDAYATQQIASITAGTRLEDTGPDIDGASQNVNYRDVKNTMSQDLVVGGMGAAATIEAGAIFTIAGVFAVNNRSRQTLPRLQQFVVLEDATMDGSGDGTLSISPPIIVAGTNDGVGTLTNTAFQTVSAAPADGAAIVFHTAPAAVTPVKAMFQREAIQMVSARLPTPFSDTSAFVTDPETGISIRYWRGSDISTGQHIHRWDTIFGAENVRRDMGVRLNGTAP